MAVPGAEASRQPSPQAWALDTPMRERAGKACGIVETPVIHGGRE